MRSILQNGLLLLSSMLISISFVPSYLCLAKDSMGMPDKDSKAKPAWGKSEAGLAGFIPFDGPKSKFYPPWKIPKPVDVPQIPLGNFHNMHSAPSVWGTTCIAREPSCDLHSLSCSSVWIFAMQLSCHHKCILASSCKTYRTNSKHTSLWCGSCARFEKGHRKKSGDLACADTARLRKSNTVCVSPG